MRVQGEGGYTSVRIHEVGRGLSRTHEACTRVCDTPPRLGIVFLELSAARSFVFPLAMITWVLYSPFVIRFAVCDIALLSSRVSVPTLKRNSNFHWPLLSLTNRLKKLEIELP